MSERTLVNFNRTREDIPPRAGFDPTRETPYEASMAHENLRIGPIADHARFLKVLILACQMIERANPGRLAMMTDHETDADGHVTACTVTVLPEGTE